jgi:hypothetical protein
MDSNLTEVVPKARLEKGARFCWERLSFVVR